MKVSLSLLITALLILSFLIPSAIAGSIEINGTQYYEQLDGSMTSVPNLRRI